MAEHRFGQLPLNACFVFTVMLCSSGCDFPRDPEGTLERVRGGTLRVGVTASEPWTDWAGRGQDRRPRGIEVELVKRFAAETDAEIVWVRGSKSELFESLEAFRLDLVLGGITEDTPWSDRIGLSRCYLETDDGRHVIAVAPGENGFLLRFDQFLARNDGYVRKLVDEASVVSAKDVVP